MCASKPRQHAGTFKQTRADMLVMICIECFVGLVLAGLSVNLQGLSERADCVSEPDRVGTREPVSSVASNIEDSTVTSEDDNTEHREVETRDWESPHKVEREREREERAK